MSPVTGHTISVHDVAVGQRWRNKKSGIDATVKEIHGDNAVLTREHGPTTTKWLDLLVIEYDLLSDEKDVG